MTILLALDPGETTGATLWTFTETKPIALLSTFQIAEGILGFMKHAELDKTNIVVSEKFVLDGRTPNPNVTPLLIEGALIAQQKYYPYKLTFQRNNFKKHVSDDLLKENDLWAAGYPHAMDSAKHALAYMKTIRHMPTLRKYFMID
jgi:hypothetical protein